MRDTRHAMQLKIGILRQFQKLKRKFKLRLNIYRLQKFYVEKVASKADMSTFSAYTKYAIHVGKTGQDIHRAR